MISEESYDTDTGVMMLKIQLCITGINYIYKIFKFKTVALNSNGISQYY